MPMLRGPEPSESVVDHMVQDKFGGSEYDGDLECGGVLGTRLKRDQIHRCGRSEDNVADESRAIKYLEGRSRR